MILALMRKFGWKIFKVDYESMSNVARRITVMIQSIMWKVVEKKKVWKHERYTTLKIYKKELKQTKVNK